MTMRIIWILAFVFLVIYLHEGSTKERGYTEQEQQCIADAVDEDDMRGCFKLMDRNKAERDKS